MNTNMINPANYYNPFAKYNYVSKTRGAYVSKDAQIFDTTNFGKKNSVEKSANIWDENYDANTDIEQMLEMSNNKEVTGETINRWFDAVSKRFGLS